jgi:hypothetical protein
MSEEKNNYTHQDWEKLAKSLEAKLNKPGKPGLIDLRSKKERENKIEDIFAVEKEFLPKEEETLWTDWEAKQKNQTFIAPPEKDLPAMAQKSEISAEKKQRQINRAEHLKERRLRQKNNILAEKNFFYQNKHPWLGLLPAFKKIIIFLIGLEILAYFLSTLSALAFLSNLFFALILLIDLIVFIWLPIHLIKKCHQDLKTSAKLCLLIAVLVGFFRAVFKIFWFNQLWTIVNAIIEPLLIMVAVLVILSLFELLMPKKIKEPDYGDL